MQNRTLLTIGELAGRVGLRTSALRYYEEEGLLTPPARSDSGYRLYPPEVEQDLRFIQRARRLGFSLNDIRILLKAWREGSLDEQAFLETAERRYLELEQQITQVQILQHELGLFLQEIYGRVVSNREEKGSPLVSRLLEQICSHLVNPYEMQIFDRVLERSGCLLQTGQARLLLESLKGMHIHIWQEDDGVSILVVSKDPQVGETLNKISQLSQHCKTHANTHLVPELMHNSEGYLLQVHGEHAFILARFFLMIERTKV
jgi:MerR family transcriptional regulator, copper efflux regulator